MSVGDCMREIASLLDADGFSTLAEATPFAWLCQQGHFALPASEERDALERIYVALGGDLDLLATSRTTRLRVDLLHVPTGTAIEVDESQHFTSDRLITLGLYPEGAALGFDADEYRSHCHAWFAKADQYRRAKDARGFGPGGRRAQRAYYDALKDLGASAMGVRLLRIAAPERDAKAAYAAHRDRLLAALTKAEA